MFQLTGSLSYFPYNGPVDMRKGFDGLCGLVQGPLGRDPLHGEVFIFINRRGDRIKLLHWEAGGFVLYYKRLEAGTFERPVPRPGEAACQVSWAGLVMMVEGISLGTVRLRKRYKATKKAS
jgi:transposase